MDYYYSAVAWLLAARFLLLASRLLYLAAGGTIAKFQRRQLARQFANNNSAIGQLTVLSSQLTARSDLTDFEYVEYSLHE